jgi:hypothetical protein
VAVSGRKQKRSFWDVLKRDASKNLLDCYEIRLEEIVESFTGSTKRFWRHQKGIAARKKRTMLFESDIFRNRRNNGECYGWETLGCREGTCAKKVHYFVREQLLKKAGYRIEGVEWEETLLYAIASNGDFFGTGMMALSEKQLYRKFCKVIEIHSIARLDNEVIKDIQFYSRLVAIYNSKMKKYWVRIDGNMKGQGRRNENIIHELKVQREDERNLEEINNYLLEHPECDFRKNDGYCVTSKAVYKEEVFNKKRKKRKRRFKKLWGNCPSLKDFKGSLIINRELILEKKRKKIPRRTFNVSRTCYLIKGK